MGKRSNVSDEDFLKAAKTATSIKEVAEAVGMSPNAVFSRVKSLRQNGIVIAHLSSGKRDWQAMRKLAASLGFEVTEPVAATNGTADKPKRTRKAK